MHDSIRESAEKAVALLASVAAEFRKGGQKINGLIDKVSEHGLEAFLNTPKGEFPFSFGVRPGRKAE
jgi:hypothetical protein